jgi:glutathionylspermidine synthase
MTTKVLADTPLCGYETVITAKLAEDGGVTIEIETNCEEVQALAEELEELRMEELATWENPLWELAKWLTPTCIVPSAVMNAAWVEAGLMSRSLALEKREQKIVFLE